MNAKLATISQTLCLAAIVAGASPLAAADDSGWYGGANVGQAQAEIDEDRIVGGLADGGFTTTSFSDDEEDLGFKVFAGYQINKYFAVEGGYFDLGEFEFTAETVPAGTLAGTIEVQGWNFDIVGFVPFTEKFSAFARAGANYAEARDTFRGTGLVTVLGDPNPEERDTNYKYGVGLQADFTERVGMRFEAERYRIDDAVGNKGDIDLYSLGLLVRFGASEPPPAPPAEAPAPAPAPVPPAPVDGDSDGDGVPDSKDKCPGTRPGVRVDHRGCEIVDEIQLPNVNFEFDSAVLTSDSTETLDGAVSTLNRYPELQVECAGHTDSVGSDAYNQGLSQRRAGSVCVYLKGHGIDASRLTERGYGESQPIADNESDAGRAQNRRVTLRITGGN